MFTVKVIKSMLKNDNIQIVLNGEGPCAKALGLYNLLDYLCIQFNYDKKITIVTANLIEKSSKYNIKKIPNLIYLNVAKTVKLPSTKNKNLKHFGMFIGHSNLHRLDLSSYVHKNFINKSIQSFHTNVTDHYHKRFIGIDDMLFAGKKFEDVENAITLIKRSPITLDDIDKYPILQPTTYNICKVYPDFFAEVVCLSFFSGNAFHLDEKVWRPIVMKTPFIVQGPANFLNNLKKLGFETFSKWWPEGYSEDPSDAQVGSIKLILNDIAALSQDELFLMYNDMTAVLDHNHNTLMNLNRQKIMELFCD
jgi:hypothetical protein